MTGEDGAALFAGRFVLGDLLGVGGSAAVYEAEDTAAPDSSGAPRRVAVKVLHQHLSADAALREAFLGEARAAALVRHPNVAAVYDCGVQDAGGTPLAWLALELVAGGSVADRVAAGGPLAPVEAAAVLDGVLAALGAAHAVGLVHRDVSPGNVLLARDPRGGPVEATDVRLADFGLADATGRPAIGADVLGATSGGTVATGVVGSAHYLSPEQALGRPVRAAGDVYQVGALGYFLLTGQPPYPRSSVADVLAAHVSAPPPVPSAVVAAARPLDRVVTHAMAKIPARRYRDAAEFRTALAEAVAGLRAATPIAVDHLAPADGAGATTGTHPGVVVVGTASDPGDDEAGPETTRVLPPGAAPRLGYLEPGAVPAPADPWRAPVPAGRGFAAVGVAVALIGAVVWGAVAATSTSGPTPPPTISASPAVTSTPSLEPEPSSPRPSPPAEPDATVEPVLVAVPVLSGALAEAEAALRDVGLSLGLVTRVESSSPADRVLGQQPPAGQEVAAGSPVDVTVASGRNAVPTVAGLTAPAAAAQLASAGFTAATGPAAPPPDATVSGTQPPAGTVLPIGTTVELLVAPPPTVTPTTTPTAVLPAPPQGDE